MDFMTTEKGTLKNFQLYYKQSFDIFYHHIFLTHSVYSASETEKFTTMKNCPPIWEKIMFYFTKKLF